MCACVPTEYLPSKKITKKNEIKNQLSFGEGV